VTFDSVDYSQVTLIITIETHSAVTGNYQIQNNCSLYSLLNRALNLTFVRLCNTLLYCLRHLTGVNCQNTSRKAVKLQSVLERLEMCLNLLKCILQVNKCWFDSCDVLHYFTRILNCLDRDNCQNTSRKAVKLQSVLERLEMWVNSLKCIL